MLETFTYETFAQHIGTTFRCYADAEQSLDIVLAEATVQRETNAPPGTTLRMPFSLIFRGPRTIILPQSMYRVVHEHLGSFDLFLVPLGPDQTGMRYEAIFA